jgi:PAS domain S-box-containing protein
LLALFRRDKLTVDCVNTRFPNAILCRWSLSWIVPLLAILSAGAAEPKRVLVIHSFVSAAPPFTTHSTAFEAALTEQLGEPVDLDEVSLDMARYADSDVQEALVEYLGKRQAKWQADVVVPIGSPAGIFVARYRDRLFPGTPIVYTGMDRRRLPRDALQTNAAFVGDEVDVPGFVEDILQVAPGTTNIAVVLGATPLEQHWAGVFHRDFARFTNRVSFTFLNDLPFDQMLERVSKLPPRSFIFLTLLLRDVTGVTHNADEALKRIHAVANAPVNSIFQHQLGLGIVGGRLYQAELAGVETARVVISILHGEPASSFPPRIVGTLSPRYDWRELQRWKIDWDHLPPGSTVLFREATVWDRYGTWIVTGVSVFIAQAILISILLANLVKRRRAERSLEESEHRFRAAADTAPIMIWVTGPDKLCTFLNRPWLEFTGRTLDQDLGNGWADSVHPDDVQACVKTYVDAFEARQPFVMEYRLRRHDGEYRWICDTGRPQLDNQGSFVGYIGSCVDVTESRRKTEALAESENRLRAILDTAVEGIITISERGVIESVNVAAERIFGYTAAEMIGQNVSMLMPDPFRSGHDRYLTNYHDTHKAKIIGTGREVSGRRKDGSVFPIDLGVSEIALADRRVFTGVVRDITERKQAEQTARELSGRLISAQEVERARLARELHDDITQRLACLAIDAGRVEAARDGVERGRTMRDVRDGLVRLSEDVHSLSYKLHPALLEDLGLPDALKAECERFARQESIPVEVKLEPIQAAVPRDAGLCLFRVTQEALRNVARHAQARSAAVSLRRLDGGLQLAVMDSGVGFDPVRPRQRASLGLASMRERVRLLGGELDVESTPGHGTSIVAWVPVKGAP